MKSSTFVGPKCNIKRLKKAITAAKATKAAAEAALVEKQIAAAKAAKAAKVAAEKISRRRATSFAALTATLSAVAASKEVAVAVREVATAEKTVKHVKRGFKLYMRREARIIARATGRKAIARRAEVTAAARAAVKISKAETSFSALCREELKAEEAFQTEALKAHKSWINPQEEPDESMFLIVAAAQAATTKWIRGLADSVRQAMNSNGVTPDFEMLPSINRSSKDTVKILAAVVRSSFIHRSMTYDLAAGAVKNVLKIDLDRKDQTKVVEWLRVFGMFELDNDLTRTHVVSRTENGVEIQEVVKSQPTAVLTQRMLQLLDSCLHENVRRYPAGQVPAPVDPNVCGHEDGTFTSKEGRTPFHTQHAEILSIPGERASTALNKLASVPLCLSKHFVPGLTHIWLPQQISKIQNESLELPEDERERFVEKQTRLANKTHARLCRLAQAIGANAFYLLKFFDYRGRIYDGSGELSIQGLKAMRGFFGFYEAQEVDWDVINVQKGRLFLESRGIKRKLKDEEVIQLGRDWDGKTEKGGIYGPAVMLFEDPARAICCLDANQQGYQVCAVGFGGNGFGKGLAMATNITRSDKGNLMDLYSIVAGTVGNETRGQSKAWMLPYLYGAGAKACLRDYNAEMPANKQATLAQMKAWIKAFEEAFPAVKVLKEHISRAFARYYDVFDQSEDNVRAMAAVGPAFFEWLMPDGFLVKYAINEVESLVLNKEFKIKLNSTWQRSLAAMVISLAPNIVHSVDSYMLRRMTELCDFPIVPVHDSYGCHSCNVPAMKVAISTIMKELSELDILNDILKQITVVPAKADAADDMFSDFYKEVKVGSTGLRTLETALMDSDYMFM